MSGRHQNTTLRAIDLWLQERLVGLVDQPNALADVLVELPEDGDGDLDHAESVWAREMLPDILRPELLLQFFPSRPMRWGPLLAETLANTADIEWRADALRQLASPCSIMLPDAYGLLIYFEPKYRRRFSIALNLPTAPDGLVDALGGIPYESEPDLRYALNDRQISAAAVKVIASKLSAASIPILPSLGTQVTLPHGVEAFDLDPDHLGQLMLEIRAFFARAAAKDLAIDVTWHPNP